MTIQIREKERKKKSSGQRNKPLSLKGQGHKLNRSEQMHEQPSPKRKNHPLLQLQRTHSNQEVQQLVKEQVQPKLEVGLPDDKYEREADRVADAVMRISEPATIGAETECSAAVERIQRMCPRCQNHHRQGKPLNCEECEEELQRKTDGNATSAVAGGEQAAAVTGESGRPLSSSTKSFFENRMNSDFSDVRIHTGPMADRAARSLDARAFTIGSDVVFRTDEYRPGTPAGKQLLAHELTHVVQQAAAPNLSHGSANGSAEATLETGAVGDVVQRQSLPGQGMRPPGDCSWATYLGLRGGVISAKALVSSLGACSPGDSCVFLATKIAAISAEIAARIGLDARCFRGGNSGHRKQVQDKVNMLKRCYPFFTNSNCPQSLIEAMEEVVERAREVIAQAAKAVVVVAGVVALIAATILLVKAIIAAGVGAAAAATAAAVLAVLLKIQDLLSSDDSSQSADSV